MSNRPLPPQGGGYDQNMSAYRQQQQYQQQGQPYHQQQQQPRPVRTQQPRTSRPPPANYNGTRASRDMLEAGNQPYRRVSLSRARSLSRPERQRPRPGMLRGESSEYRARPMGPAEQQRRMRQQMQQQQQYPQQPITSSKPLPQGPIVPPPPSKQPMVAKPKDRVVRGWWGWTARIVTCCLPNWFIKTCFRKQNALMQQAWREKLTLVYIILICCLALCFITVGLQRALCPAIRQTYPYSQEFEGHREKVYRENVTIYGQIYPFSEAKTFFQNNGLNLTNDFQNTDLSGIFDGDAAGACASYDANHPNSSLGSCRVNDPYGGWIEGKDGKCLSLKDLQQTYTSTASLSYDWVDLQPTGIDTLGKSPLLIYGDTVLNISKYLDANTQYFGATGDTILRNGMGNDASYALMNNAQIKSAIPCLTARYQAGVISTENGGCIASGIIMNVMIAVIIAVVAIRYTMAVIFQWLIARSLVKPGGRSGFLSWRSKAGGNDDPANHIRAPTNMYNTGGSSNASVSSLSNTDAGSPTASAVDLKPGIDIVSTKLYTMLQVTCYSEGEESMRTTMDSLANTTYSNKHKVFMVIADGLITGSGESRSTPDIVIDMMDLDPTMADPKPCSYLAIADGEKQLNMAKVYAGHYKGVACLLIVKCGGPAEANSPKPGNRGKRDSQMILMAFFQRVLFNDRLSELDYEMFWKLTWLTKGVTPDKFETVLMVDADTKVLPDALTYMVAAMVNDITIMGLCGETRIANKRTSCK